MASKFATSMNSSSHLIYDFSCSICEENDLNTKSQFYCGKCSKCYCGQCVVFHNGMFKKHAVMDRKDINKWVGRGDTLARCDLHPEEIIKMECEDHSQLCCHLCVALNHRMCHSISLVEDLARGIYKMADFKQLPTDMSKLTSSLTQVIEDRKMNKNSLQESGKSILTKIKALRDTLNQLLNELEKKTVEQMDSVLADLDGSLQKDIDPCTHIHNQLKALMDNIQESGKDNEPNSYIGLRKCEDKMREAKSLHHEMLPKPEIKVSFQADTQAKEVLSQLKTLGAIQNVSEVLAGSLAKQEVQPVDPTKAFRAMKGNKYNIKLKTEKNHCYIRGIAEIQSREIILVDCNNSKLKMLNSRYEVTTHFDVPQYPQEICHTKGNELAVVLDNGFKLHEIHFLTVSAGSITMTRKFSVDHSCNSIRYHQGQLYVGSKNALYLYNTTGQMVKKLYEDTSSGWTVNRFALSPDGRKIYIPDPDHQKLITIDNKGNILATLKDPYLFGPVGVHVSEVGHVFVYSYYSHTVMQVDQEGRKKLVRLVRKGDGINFPRAVWYSRGTGMLIVGGDQNDILVVKLQ